MTLSIIKLCMRFSVTPLSRTIKYATLRIIILSILTFGITMYKTLCMTLKNAPVRTMILCMKTLVNSIKHTA